VESQLSKTQINSIIETKLQAYVKNLFKAEELETRFTSLETLTENLRKRHREQDKVIAMIRQTLNG
jgi:hypothetical protein